MEIEIFASPQLHNWTLFLVLCLPSHIIFAKIVHDEILRLNINLPFQHDNLVHNNNALQTYFEYATNSKSVYPHL